MNMIKMIGLTLISITTSIVGAILSAAIIFYIGFQFEYPERDLIKFYKASSVQSDMLFADIKAINIHADNIDLTVVESDTDTVSIKNSIETTGFGVISDPKIWVSGTTLFYDQGLIMNRDTWDILEDTLATNTSGSFVIEVPRNMKLDFTIKNPNGTIDFDIAEANNVSISTNHEFDFKTNCGSLKIIAKNQDIDIYGHLSALEIFSKNGNINIYESINTIKAMTKNGDISLYTSDEPDSIDFTSKNGRLNIYNTDTINELSSFFKEDN